MVLYMYLSYRKSCSVWIGKHIDRKMSEDNLLYQTLRITVKSPQSDLDSCLNIKKKEGMKKERTHSSSSILIDEEGNIHIIIGNIVGV